MKAYGKSWNYNVYDCQYCLYWRSNKVGCTYEDGCCCKVPQKPARRNGVEMFYGSEKTDAPPTSECIDCPYGRASPCIGWCTKEVMRSMGLLKERGKDNV